MVAQERLVTVEEFEEFLAQEENSDQYFELIDGEIVEKVPTEEHGMIAGNIYGNVWTCVKANKLGRVTIEVRHRNPEDRYNSRQPDISFTGNERLQPLVKQGAVLQFPDLAIEVKSPDDTYALMRRKAAYYLANGTRMVWLVYPAKQIVEVYRSEEDIEILTAEDVLTGGDVLPGFEMQVSAIFAE